MRIIATIKFATIAAIRSISIGKSMTIRQYLAAGLLSLIAVSAMAQNTPSLVGRWVSTQNQGGWDTQVILIFDNQGRYRYELLGRNQQGAVQQVCVGTYDYRGDSVFATPQQCQACGGGNCYPRPVEGNAEFNVEWIDRNNWNDGAGSQYHRG
jgi:hypothetical protein